MVGAEHCTRRRGFALAAALLALVLIAALIAGVLFAATEETRAGAAGGEREAALNACESAIAMTITDPGLRLPDSIGIAGTVSGRVRGPGPSTIVYITRLDSAVYSVVAETVAGSDSTGATWRVGVVVSASTAGDDSITIVPISERPWVGFF
jgi:Tfp pilus assembly protein PilX